MKAKIRLNQQRNRHREEPLPYELGTHLFALIRRNLLANRGKSVAQTPTQLTFAL